MSAVIVLTKDDFPIAPAAISQQNKFAISSPQNPESLPSPVTAMGPTGTR
jgi:hypothetical protein